MQSLHRALDLVEVVAARGGHLTIGEIAAATDVPAAHRAPAAAHAGRPRLHAADAQPPLRPRVPAGAARRDGELDGGRGHRGGPRPAGRRARRDRQPGDPVRLPRGVRRPGAVAAHDADVHRGRPAGRPALHRRGQGAARPARRRPGPRDRPPRRAARSRPSTPWSPRPPCWPTSPQVRARGYALDEQEQEAGRPLRRRPGRARADVVDGGVGLRPGHPDDRRARSTAPCRCCTRPAGS